MGPGGALAAAPGARRARVWAWVVALALTQAGAAADCPKVCECKWRDGKEVVACRDAHFIDVPRGLAASTQVLDLRHNNLRILPRDAFVYTGLVNLQKVWLNFCNLTRLEGGAFRLLSNVVELDLSNNLLSDVPTAALRDLPGLRELRVAHNLLTRLAPAKLEPVPDLVLLDLSHNAITTVTTGALDHMSRLQVLNLADNHLTTLPEEHLRPLQMLRVAHLDGNPWRCDCHLRPLSRWMQERNLAASVRPVCASPRRLLGQEWQTLSTGQFVCAPVVTAAAPRVLAAEGENVTLSCKIVSEVEVSVTWVARNAPLDNSSDALRYSVTEEQGDEINLMLSSLTILDVAAGDEGTYHCQADNVAGSGHVNLTLQVAHQVAEVRVATLPPHPLLPWGALGGAAALTALILPTCLLIYCRARRTPPQRPAKMAPAPPASDESSSLPGYQVVPTCDNDESQSRSTQSWGTQDPLGAIGEGHQDGGATVAPSSVAYVEVPKCGVGAARTTLDPGRWGASLSLCSHPSGPQDPSGQYPDLLDLPRPPYFPLHTLDYCTLPRRSKAHAESTSTSTSTSTTSTTTRQTTEGAEDTTANIHSYHNYHYYQQQPTSYQEAASFRSSSALNLALSEAASHAYYAHLPAHVPTNCPPSVANPHHHHHHHPHALHDLMLVYRSQCTGSEGGNCPAGEGVAEGTTEGATGTEGGGACAGTNPQDPHRFEYHAAQLERFLREYRCLQEQLVHMKQSYQAQQLQQLRGSVPRLDCCSEALLTSGISAIPPLPSSLVTDPLSHVMASVHAADPSIAIPVDPSLPHDPSIAHIPDPSLAHMTASSHVNVSPLSHVTVTPLTHVTVSPLPHVMVPSSHLTAPAPSRVTPQTLESLIPSSRVTNQAIESLISSANDPLSASHNPPTASSPPTRASNSPLSSSRHTSKCPPSKSSKGFVGGGTEGTSDASSKTEPLKSILKKPQDGSKQKKQRGSNSPPSLPRQ